MHLERYKRCRRIVRFPRQAGRDGTTLLSALVACIPMTNRSLRHRRNVRATMGVVTGKGPLPLIREEFGFVPFVSYRRGASSWIGQRRGGVCRVASSMPIFGISKYISVPIAACRVDFASARIIAAPAKKIFPPCLRLRAVFILFASGSRRTQLVAGARTSQLSLAAVQNGGYLLIARLRWSARHAPVAILLYQALRRKARGAPQYPGPRPTCLVGTSVAGHRFLHLVCNRRDSAHATVNTYC